MPLEDRALVYNVLSWLSNVSTSVVIVFVNKVLMGPQGYAFHFAVTLCALHFLSCGLGLSCMKALNIMSASRKQIPWKDRVIFAAAANISIASLNLSLMVNSVGFYQISKLLIIPFTAAVEALWLRDMLSMPQTICTAVVLSGVAIVTVSDVTATMGGTIVAGVSVASSAMQQILCRFYLKKHAVSSHDLLSATAPLQGWTLLAVGPVIDRLVGRAWVTSYEASVPALTCLALSCAVAVLVNVSQFMCLGRFSAVTFQVTGHAKTILVLVGSWLYLRESLSMKQLTGMALAVAGMVAYGYFAALRAGGGGGGGGGGRTVGLSAVEKGGSAQERLPLLMTGAGAARP